jgi:6-pyruvoyl-tetrahydropterin synthase
MKRALKSILKSFDIHTLIDTNDMAKNFKENSPLIEEKLDSFFKTQLPKKMPIVSMFIGDKTTQQLKEVFMEELDTIFPEVIESIVQKGNFNLKITEIVNNQIRPKINKIIQYSFAIGCFWGCLIALMTTYFLR